MAQYSITPNLYYEAVKLARRRLDWIVGPTIIFFLLLVGFLNSNTEDGFNWPAFIPVAAFNFFLLVCVPVIQRRRIRRIYTQQKSLQEAINLDIGEDALTWTAPSGSARIAWGNLYRWKGNDRLTVVYESQAIMRIIPHDSLSPDELGLLKRKLENVKKG